VLKTSSGKLRRGATRDRYLAGRLASGPGHPLWQLVRVGLVGLGKRASRLVRLTPRYLYAGYAWTLLIILLPWVVLGVLVLPRPSQRWGLVRAGIGLLRRLTFIRLKVTGAEQLPRGNGPLVLISNHQSYLDALLLIEAVPHPLVFVAKRELETIPLVGRMLSRLGTLFVERFDLRRSAAESRHFAAELERGRTLAFFPEGTFRDHAGLLPFRMGAFAAAAQAGVPILPVALNGTREILRGDSRTPSPGKAQVFIGSELAPGGEGWSDAARLRDEARAFVLRHCGERDSKRPSPD